MWFGIMFVLLVNGQAQITPAVFSSKDKCEAMSAEYEAKLPAREDVMGYKHLCFEASELTLIPKPDRKDPQPRPQVFM